MYAIALARRRAERGARAADGGDRRRHARWSPAEVPALAGYLEDGVTAQAGAARRPGGLRAAIEDLLDSPAERERLAAAASPARSEWTYAEYFAAVGELVCRSL